MADFKQAIQWLKEGRKVRRPNWAQDFRLNIPYKFGICAERNPAIVPEPFSYDFKIEDFEATDWEIYEEKQICMKENCNKEAMYPLCLGVYFCKEHWDKIVDTSRKLPKMMHEEIAERKDYFKEKVEFAYNCCVDCEKTLEECTCKKEKTLSDQIYKYAPGAVRCSDSISTEYVKECFDKIKEELKEKLGDAFTFRELVEPVIDKHAGSKLI